MNNIPSDRFSNRNIYVLLTLTSFLWAGAFIAGKLGVYSLSPAILTFLRMGVAALLIFPFLIWKEKTTWRLQASEIKYAIATALTGMVGYHMFFFSALSYTTASKASMIGGANPLITAVLATFFASEKLTLKKTVMLFIALLGVVNIVIGGDFEVLLSMDLNKGDLLMLCGSFLWAVYSIIVRNVVPFMGPLKLTSYSFLFSAIFMAPFAIYDFIYTDAFNVGFNPYLAVLYMAVFPTVIGYSIQQLAVSKIGPSKTSLFINLVPVISTALAVIFLKEKIEPYHVIGTLMIIGAVIGYNRK